MKIFYCHNSSDALWYSVCLYNTYGIKPIRHNYGINITVQIAQPYYTFNNVNSNYKRIVNCILMLTKKKQKKNNVSLVFFVMF